MATRDLPAQDPARPAEPDADLTELSLEDLMDVEVTTVSKRAQKRQLAPAAVHVITNQQLRQSGATSIPEALRTVPGLHVARISSSRWAVTSRGFGGQFANKLLVLIDGRSVYTPLFSGTYWDVQDVMLEDVDRIEVIRGPGGALWGANAVNGVINVITKNARNSQGSIVSGGMGTEELGFLAARHGGTIGSDGAFRVYAKGLARDGQKDAADRDTDDRWQQARAGFRADWDLSSVDALTVQGDAYRGINDELFRVPTAAPPFMPLVSDDVHVAGANLLTRWRRAWDDAGETTVQSYWDYTDRDEPIFRERRHTADLDVQHALPAWGRHRVMVGVAYRYSEDDADGSATATLAGGARGDHLFSMFVHDEIALVDDAVTVSMGLKVERNDYTDWEFQPDLRLRWSLNRNHTLWGAVSRAVRTPLRGESDASLVLSSMPGPFNTVTMTTLNGTPGLRAEDVLAFDLGYRLELEDRLFVDVAGFYNIYDDLITLVQGTPGPPPVVTVPLSFENSREGESVGLELAATWAVRDGLRLSAAYSYVEENISETNPAAVSTGGPGSNTPENQVHLSANWNATESLEVGSTLSWIDRVSGFDIPSFVRLDGRLAWRLQERSTFELILQNLLDDRHPEFGQEAFWVSTELERGAYFRFTHEF